jgi:hypothetical protein
MCKYIDGVGSIEHYFNSQRARPSFLLNENPTVGISNSVVSTDQGYLICSFSREKANPSIENYFDLNMDYYLLLAKASINGLNLFIFYINQPFLFLFYHFLGQTIAYHSTNRLFSSEKLNFVPKNSSFSSSSSIVIQSTTLRLSTSYFSSNPLAIVDIYYINLILSHFFI